MKFLTLALAAVCFASASSASIIAPAPNYITEPGSKFKFIFSEIPWPIQKRKVSTERVDVGLKSMYNG